MLVDKPAGITSHDVVATVRRRFKTKAVGHTGTLDPFATGLLVMVLGGATRLARFVEAERKTYWAVARLGQATATDDATGDPIGPAWDGEWPVPGAVDAALGALEGPGMQRPPVFSAKSVDGVRSYALARRGEAVALEPVAVLVERLELLAYAPPLVTFRATVGAGTYIRAIARDLGERLGTAGHLESLRREAVGRFTVAEAVPLDRLTGGETLIPPVDLLPFDRVEVTAEEAAQLRLGQRVGSAGTGMAALVHDGALVAVGEGRDGRWQPVVVPAAA